MFDDLIDSSFKVKHLDMTQHYAADGDIVKIDDVECNAPFELNVNSKEIKLSIYSPNPLRIRPVIIVAKQRNCTLHFYKNWLVSSENIGSKSKLRRTVYTSNLMLAMVGRNLPGKLQGFKFEFDDFYEWYQESNCRKEIYPSPFNKNGDPVAISEQIGLVNNEVRIVVSHNPYGEKVKIGLALNYVHI